MDVFVKHFSQDLGPPVNTIAFVGPSNINKSSLLDAILGTYISRDYDPDRKYMICTSPEIPSVVCYDWTVRSTAKSFLYQDELPGVSCLVLVADIQLKEIDIIIAKACHSHKVPCAFVYCHAPKRADSDEMLKWKLRDAIRQNKHLRECVELDTFVLCPLDLFKIRSGRKARGKQDELLFASWLLQVCLLRQTSVKAWQTDRQPQTTPSLSRSSAAQSTTSEDSNKWLSIPSPQPVTDCIPRPDVLEKRILGQYKTPPPSSSPVPPGFVDIDGMLLKRAKVSEQELANIGSAATRFPSGPQNSPRTDLIFTNKIKAYSPDLSELTISPMRSTLPNMRMKQVDFATDEGLKRATLETLPSHGRCSSAGTSTVQRNIDDILEWQTKNNAEAFEVEIKRRNQAQKLRTSLGHTLVSPHAASYDRTIRVHTATTRAHDQMSRSQEQGSREYNTVRAQVSETYMQMTRDEEHRIRTPDHMLGAYDRKPTLRDKVAKKLRHGRKQNT